MVWWVVGSIIHWAIFHSSQCSMTSVTKAVVCAILSVGWCTQKNPYCWSERVAHVAAAGFISCYLNGSLPYVWCHITVNKMCWVCHLIKHFLPSLSHEDGMRNIVLLLLVNNNNNNNNSIWLPYILKKLPKTKFCWLLNSQYVSTTVTNGHLFLLIFAYWSPEKSCYCTLPESILCFVFNLYVDLYWQPE